MPLEVPHARPALEAGPSPRRHERIVALQLLCSALLKPDAEAEGRSAELVEKNTFLEFKPGGQLRRSNSSPSLFVHDDQSTDLGEESSRHDTLSSAGSYDELEVSPVREVPAPREVRVAHAPRPEERDKDRRKPSLRAPLAEKARQLAYPANLVAYGLTRDADQGASMRRLLQLAQAFPQVVGAELVPKKRNVVKLRLAPGADGLQVLDGLRDALGEAPFVCGAPRVGRKEALLKLRVFDMLPQGSPSDICYNFARKGKCKWQMCEWLHPRTSAAVLSL